MSNSIDQLPAEIVDALRRGDLITAIKLLRSAKGLGLKEAKDFLDMVRRGGAGTGGSANSSGPQQPEFRVQPRSGKLDVIGLLRGRAGLARKEPADTPDGRRQPRQARADGLAPGEVPPENSLPWWIAAAVIAGLAAYYFFSGG
jgi:hypothetical protein